MRTSLLTLVACLMIAIAAAADDGEAHARKALVGEWKGFAVEGKGEQPDRGAVKLELVIDERSVHGVQVRDGERMDHGRWELTFDLKASPRWLDAVRTNERGRKETWLGIYRLEGDTLYWCVGRRVRPTAFETVQGRFLLILKRQQPPAEAGGSSKNSRAEEQQNSR
jgi:uncharacterized protein (TIGR03067 family)